MNGQDDFLRRQEALGESLNRTANQWNNQLAQLLGYLAGQMIRAIFERGGIYMEMFLRYNFGVAYFPPLFSLVTTMALAFGIYHSAQVLLLTPANDTSELHSAASLLIASILIAIPWTIHGVSILGRFNTFNQDSQYTGDSWLDDLNKWMRSRRGRFINIVKGPLAWLCANSFRHDFFAESIVGFTIAHAVGWLCFNHAVTKLLVYSLVLMQLKRVFAAVRKLNDDRKASDARKAIERNSA